MIAYRIAALRKRIGMNQADLAVQLNLSPSAVGMYEQGRRTPNLDMLVKLSTIFDVSLDFLITGSEHIYAGEKKPLPIDCPCATCYWKKYIAK